MLPPTFSISQRKGESFGDLQALGERSFGLGGSEQLGPFPGPGFGLDESQTQ